MNSEYIPPHENPNHMNNYKVIVTDKIVTVQCKHCNIMGDEMFLSHLDCQWKGVTSVPYLLDKMFKESFDHKN